MSLSTDAYLPFSTDIDGDPRPYNRVWDIGADEAIPVGKYQMEGYNKFEGYIKFE